MIVCEEKLEKTKTVEIPKASTFRLCKAGSHNVEAFGISAVLVFSSFPSQTISFDNVLVQLKMQQGVRELFILVNV